MLIDAHQHVNWLGHDVRKLIADMDEVGIDMCWLLTWECDKEEMTDADARVIFSPHSHGMPLADVVEASRLYPERIIPFYAPHPKKRNALSQLRQAVEMFGIRGCGEFKFRVRFDDPDAVAIFNLCGELSLPVLFHIDVPLPRGKPMKEWQAWYCYDIDAVESVLKMLPNVNFIGHGPGFWREISGDADSANEVYPKGKVVPGGKLIRLLAEYPNLYADISAASGYNALTRDIEHARKFLIEFQDKVLFGRDFFGVKHIELLRQLDLPKEAFEKITYKNALKLVPV
ncbi:MAG: hypothetical protein HZRFUVUK_001079 [Candidatus Fervidibacterota bacterium]|jgi:predicted TIM-barrel fold metal-dependent hydrolase